MLSTYKERVDPFKLSSGESLMYSKNNNDKRIEPWGILPKIVLGFTWKYLSIINETGLHLIIQVGRKHFNSLSQICGLWNQTVFQISEKKLCSSLPYLWFSHHWSHISIRDASAWECFTHLHGNRTYSKALTNTFRTDTPIFFKSLSFTFLGSILGIGQHVFIRWWA